MRTDAINLEENRLEGISQIEEYTAFHERHRIFPEVFEKRNHSKILDLSAGIGVVGKNIKDGYQAELICNDVSPTCLKVMEKLGLKTVSFDLDDKDKPYPFENKTFDAAISLATIEHLIHTQHFLIEIHRILKDCGFLYLSAPNYSGLPYLLPFLVSGKTFHDPMVEPSRYEFFAHIRYFTFKTLVELAGSCNFSLDTVYLPLPKESSRFTKLRSQAPWKAYAFKYSMLFVYKVFSPRWAAEPVLCFKKEEKQSVFPKTIRKVLL